jgi:hypothetical protein
MAKIVTVEAMLPELKGPRLYQNARAEGSTWPLALYRAVKILKKKIGRHRVTTMKLTVSIAEKMEDGPTNG